MNTSNKSIAKDLSLEDKFKEIHNKYKKRLDSYDCVIRNVCYNASGIEDEKDYEMELKLWTELPNKQIDLDEKIVIMKKRIEIINRKTKFIGNYELYCDSKWKNNADI